MGTISTQKFSANEKDMVVLLRETEELRKLLLTALEEMRSIQKRLTVDLSRGPEELESERRPLLDKLEDLKTDCVEFNRKAHNHSHDLQGMRECEDVSCETFYYSEHEKLKAQIENFLEGFQELKSGTNPYTGDLSDPLN